MLRILNKIGIPNVVSFRLTDPKFNVEAAKYDVKKGDRRLYNIHKTKRNAICNKYLAKQFRRLEKYARDGNLNHFNFLVSKLLTSYAFQIYSYNTVCDKWTSIPNISTIKYHLRYLRKLCHDKSTDLDMKRVWIDKKPGDAARPLGVPTMVWRVYMRMLTHLGESFVRGKGLYSDFQHGGRSGYGVQTCLIQMLNLLEKFDRIYEFDLKGFFDHVSKRSVRNFFRGTILADIYFKLLQVPPKKYILPDYQTDKAVLAAMETLKQIRAAKERGWRAGYLMWLDDEEPDLLPQQREERYQDWLQFTLLDLAKRHMGASIFDKDDYKEAMKDGVHRGGVFTNWLIQETKPYDQASREEGRDSWKDLDLPEQGIPQGSSMGPFLASTIAAFYLRKIPNLLMYVDDGMVGLSPGDPSPEKIITDALRPIKVELAPEKSFIREVKHLRDTGIKFLGTRTWVRKLSTDMHSDTRFGIQRPLINRESLLNKFRQLCGGKEVTISKWKLLKWIFLHNESRLSNLLTGQGLHVAIKYGFFGNLLSNAYSPEVSVEEMKAKIAEGVRLAEEQVRRAENSFGAGILNQNTYAYINDQGQPSYCKPDLYNLSTLSCNLLLELGVSFIRKDSTKVRNNNGNSFGISNVIIPDIERPDRPIWESRDFRRELVYVERTALWPDGTHHTIHVGHEFVYNKEGKLVSWEER